jgi:D-sedoheptulose 7-phosphate isomerase
MKAAEVAALREQTLADGAAALESAGAVVRDGGRVLALGNGGSATDAMDLVADLRAVGVPAIDLSSDSGILTAIANDIVVEAMFARQVIAYGRAGDLLVALSTSGGSANVVAALKEGRRRGMATLALVGYDGGQVAAEGLADFVVITRSQHIPRIQEAQASAYHRLVELSV